jgi:hypothetical protein
MMMQSLQKMRRSCVITCTIFGQGLGLDKQFILIDAITDCQQISRMVADFTEIILSFPQDKKKISLIELIHRDFGMEQLDDRLCANCNNSKTSEVTTSIHTRLVVLTIILKYHEYINNEQGRVNTRVDFPINGFVPNQGFDNVDMTAEYNLFAAFCHKESRDKTSGHYTAQCKIKDSNNHWTKYGDTDFASIYFINQKIEQRQRSCTILWYTFYSTYRKVMLCHRRLDFKFN